MPYRNLTVKQRSAMILADNWILVQRGPDVYTVNGIYAANLETMTELEKLGLVKRFDGWSWKKVRHPRLEHLLHRKEKATC
jgi:hypothetical protein